MREFGNNHLYTNLVERAKKMILHYHSSSIGMGFLQDSHLLSDYIKVWDIDASFTNINLFGFTSNRRMSMKYVWDLEFCQYAII